LRKLDGKRTHQSAISITLFNEPCSLQWFSRNPIQQKGVDLWANGFHEITGQAVASGSIDVPETETGIETQGGNSKASF
jgi:hypothetical protein